jgi:hypothetical protein
MSKIWLMERRELNCLIMYSPLSQWVEDRIDKDGLNRSHLSMRTARVCSRLTQEDGQSTSITIGGGGESACPECGTRGEGSDPVAPFLRRV